MAKRTVLVDADGLLYMICLSGEHAVNWADEGQPDLWTLWACEEEATVRLKAAVASYLDALNADDVVMCLTDYDRPNWRLDVLPTYKGNRAETRKPLLLNRLREITQETFTTYLRPRMEADDLLGILSTHPTLIKGEKVILTIDKDLRTIPGLIAKMPRGVIPDMIEIDTVSDEAADRFHMLQTLMGDAVDGYKGCPGCGPVKANAVLDKAKGDLWPAVVGAYEKAGLTEADALQQARVARICRHTDYSFKTKEPILWNPAPTVAE